MILSQKRLQYYQFNTPMTILMIFSNNYFYENWVKEENEISNSIKVLNYILPIENLELIKLINQSNKNYENLKIDEILLDYGNQDKALIHINFLKINQKFFYRHLFQVKKLISLLQSIILEI